MKADDVLEMVISLLKVSKYPLSADVMASGLGLTRGQLKNAMTHTNRMKHGIIYQSDGSRTMYYGLKRHTVEANR